MEKQEINNLHDATSGSVASLRVNDIGFRLILIPLFGIGIPLLTGMVNGGDFSNIKVKLSFLYSILIAFVIWEGNRYLHFSLRSYFDWYKKPVHKIVAMLLTICFYTIPVSILMLVGWYKLFDQGPPNRQIIFIATLIILVCVIFIAHVYETVFLVKASETEMLRSEQLERSKAEAELEALKNQIDPHFIFNSLNTLSHLIEESPCKAKQFNDSLADVYRYILQNKGRELVLLQEEVDFVLVYFSLLKIRFENAIQLKNELPADVSEYLVPPISLQLLMENAVKHNEFSDTEPLVIVLSLAYEEISMRNVLRKKEQRKESSRIGLNNLKERYKLTTGKDIIVRQTEAAFEVCLPLLRIDE